MSLIPTATEDQPERPSRRPSRAGDPDAGGVRTLDGVRSIRQSGALESLRRPWIWVN